MGLRSRNIILMPRERASLLNNRFSNLFGKRSLMMVITRERGSLGRWFESISELGIRFGLLKVYKWNGVVSYFLFTHCIAVIYSQILT